MSRIDEIQRLIQEHQRRLQKLKEDQATFGLHTPPHIEIQIEDTEAEIEKLRRELVEQEEAIRSRPSTAPPDLSDSKPVPPPRPPGPRPGQSRTWPATAPVARNGGPSMVLIASGIAGILLVVILIGLFIADQFKSAPSAPTGNAVVIPSDMPIPEPTFTPTPPSSGPTDPWFGGITFARGYNEERLAPIDPASRFPEGTTEIHAIFKYEGMANDLSWEVILYKDGNEVVHETKSWDGGERSTFDYSFDAGGNPLPIGEWQLELYVSGELLRAGTFTIGSE